MLYKIADLITAAEVSYPRCKGQLRKYACPQATTPDIEIAIHRDSIDAYIELGKDSEIMKGWPLEVKREEVEYMLAGAVFYRELLKYDGMLIHASAVVVDNRAYLFSGKSGVGKSTHTNLWLQHFGDKAYILNDDKPAVRILDGVLYAYGTPWSGKTNINVNRKVPVAGIIFLGQAEENRIYRMDAKAAFTALFEQTERKLPGTYMMHLLNIAEKVIDQMPIWHLDCTISEDAVKMVWERLGEEK